jgi:Heat shock protein 9/12
MSDPGRKGMGDKISEGVTPDSQKSTLQQGKEGVTDTADKVAGYASPLVG